MDINMVRFIGMILVALSLFLVAIGLLLSRASMSVYAKSNKISSSSKIWISWLQTHFDFLIIGALALAMGAIIRRAEPVVSNAYIVLLYIVAFAWLALAWWQSVLLRNILKISVWTQLSALFNRGKAVKISIFPLSLLLLLQGDSLSVYGLIFIILVIVALIIAYLRNAKRKIIEIDKESRDQPPN